MKYWIGAGLFICAAVFASFAIQRRNQVLAARKDVERRGLSWDEKLDPQSMAAFGEIMTAIVLFALAYVAIKSTFAFFVFDNGQFPSLFDMAGFYALLLGYGFWLKTKCTHRMPAEPGNAVSTLLQHSEPARVKKDAAVAGGRRAARRLPLSGNDPEIDYRPLVAISAARGTQPQIGLE